METDPVLFKGKIFLLVAAQELFTVGSPDYDTITCGVFRIMEILVEGWASHVHGGPKCIGLQPQQQFKNTLVCVHQLCVAPPHGPVIKCVLVIDEDAPIPHLGFPFYVRFIQIQI